MVKNISRPMLMLCSKENTLEKEYKLLQNVGLFKPDTPVKDIRILDEISGYGLLIIGYSKNFGIKNLRKIIDSARVNNIPILLYANGITLEHKIYDEVVNSYTYISICNTPIRLISDVFAVMSSFKSCK
ncbi:hypothetical protein NO2_0363 [Candidatus Termititenax persephonae]|uniref:Uncharacterized protein n=1 Tax=Candidatus Termititenax persephonae TaxID=2218525 RepID=A0A388TG21_9BACT|nr:hypothetical protein NO2_0363 [Candidatus Termititenax persephonae]